MSTTLQIAIPTKKAKSIKPPLNKNEIIEALALRKHATLSAELRERRDRLAKLKARLAEIFGKFTADGGTLAFSEFKDTSQSKHVPPRPGSSWAHCVYMLGGVKVTMERTIQFDQLPAEAKTIAREIFKLEQCQDWVPDLKVIKRDIRDQMTGEISGPAERIKTLLNDPATQKVLDRTLAELEKPAPKPAAIAA